MLMMLPFEAPTIFEGINKSHFRMPRVVKDQRNRFENDDLFRQLSHESAVKYTGFKDRPLEERQMKFITNCQEGHTEVSVVQSGSQFTLMFNPTMNPAYSHEGCDFDKEIGKVYIKAGFILNGVCVRWCGWVDLTRLEGFGCLEFDEYRAYLEDAMVKQSIDKQQTCNSLANNPNSLSAHLDYHSLGPGGLSLAPPQSFNPATAAAAVAAITTNSMLPPPPLGLNPGCLGPVVSLPGGNILPPAPAPVLQSASLGAGGPQQGQPPVGAPSSQLPPVSLADSAAAHYGNAALAAAAAAAFHQALSIGSAAAAAGPHSQSLHGLATIPNGSHLPLVSQHQHLPYANGSSLGAIQAPQQRSNSPLSSSHHQQQHQAHTSPQRHNYLNSSGHHQAATNASSINSGSGNNNNNSNSSSRTSAASMQQSDQITKSPERENHRQHHHHHHLLNSNSGSRRQATKRAPDEHADDVDVVSDINVHDLDFPPRRIFKSEPLAAGGAAAHQTQKAAATARRAA